MDTPLAITPAGAYAELALHVLAHVRPPTLGAERASPLDPAAALRGAASVHDPRYVTYAQRRFPEETWRWAQRDAELLAHLWGSADLDSLARASALPFLDLDLEGLGPIASRGLEELLGPGCTSALAELTWCVIGLSHADFAAAHRAIIAPHLAEAVAEVRPHLERARRAAPALGLRHISLSFVLGPRGRSVGDRIVVGAPAPWNELPATWAAMIGLHECAVSIAAAASPARTMADVWTTAEPVALAAVARLPLPADLAELHSTWAASVDRSALGETQEAAVARVVDALRRA